MRLPLQAIGLVALLLVAGTAGARPLERTTGAAHALVIDVIDDADRDGARLLRTAERLIASVAGAMGGFGLPDPRANGALEVRISLVQPGVREGDDLIAATWIGSAKGRWAGVYWVETNVGSRSPHYIETDELGHILFLNAGPLAIEDHVDITYHFLAVDGIHTVHPVGRAAMLDANPVLGRADFGGAIASARPKGPDVILLSPWNLHVQNETLGITVRAGDTIIEEVPVGACAMPGERETQPGCRRLFLGGFSPDATSVELWRLDEGTRIVERVLDRAQLQAGFTFPG